MVNYSYNKRKNEITYQGVVSFKSNRVVVSGVATSMNSSISLRGVLVEVAILLLWLVLLVVLAVGLSWLWGHIMTIKDYDGWPPRLASYRLDFLRLLLDPGRNLTLLLPLLLVLFCLLLRRLLAARVVVGDYRIRVQFINPLRKLGFLRNKSRRLLAGDSYNCVITRQATLAEAGAARVSPLLPVCFSLVTLSSLLVMLFVHWVVSGASFDVLSGSDFWSGYGVNVALVLVPLLVVLSPVVVYGTCCWRFNRVDGGRVWFRRYLLWVFQLSLRALAIVVVLFVLVAVFGAGFDSLDYYRLLGVVTWR